MSVVPKSVAPASEKNSYKSFKDIRLTDITIANNFKATSLDSLANSSNPSESLSDDSPDSDSDQNKSGQVKSSFQIQCEVYADNGTCGSLRSWAKSDGSNSESSYECLEVQDKAKGAVPNVSTDKLLAMARMETIPEEEPKISVKEILARFENLRDSKKDKNNNETTPTSGSTPSSNCSTVSSNKKNSISNNKKNPTISSTKNNHNNTKKADLKSAKENGTAKNNTNNNISGPLSIMAIVPVNNQSMLQDNNINTPVKSTANLSTTKENKDISKRNIESNTKTINKLIKNVEESTTNDVNNSTTNKENGKIENVVKENKGIVPKGSPVMKKSTNEKELQSKLAHSSLHPSSPHQMRPAPPGTNNSGAHPDNDHPQQSPSTPNNNLPLGVHPPSSNINQQHLIMENGVSSSNVPRPVSLPGMMTRENNRREQAGSPTTPGSPVPHQGRFSLLQYAMENFRQSSDLDLLKMDSSIKSKEKRKEWTWKQQTDLVKWQPHPIDGSLLRLEDPDLGPLAVECFECILRYCGDMPLTPEMSEVKCVYTVLMHCHKHIPLRDEVYCQLMKQTTSNKADTPESAQRAWRLLSIVAAYFGCSDMLGPFLLEHLSSAASDRRRICHGTAVVCLANLRKTQRCGGRKNVPSVEEVTAVSAGRSARRQIYRLPGGAERVVNTRCSTVVNDVIAELCTLIGVASEAEQQEFSLYCIVQGDAFTMPLSADEYILDVTTELHKAAQPFYLIFCRSVWYHPLKLDASPLYTEVLFNQVAPDYLEGLLLRLGNPNLPPSIVRDMSLVAALLHRAADLNHSPTLKEVKFLLPKPVLGLREPRPPQWLALVQTSWGQAASIPVARAKHRVLQVLSNWQLFGSSFFAVKRVVSGDVDNWQEHILALNRSGVHFLDMTSHETLHHWPFAEVISTRKVRSEDGSLFLDMKCGNLLQQRVTRLQTEQAHEISRLVRQYITLEQTNCTRSPQ